MSVDPFIVWDALQKISCFLYNISNRIRTLEQIVVYTSQITEDIVYLTQKYYVLCVPGSLALAAYYGDGEPPDPSVPCLKLLILYRYILYIGNIWVIFYYKPEASAVSLLLQHHICILVPHLMQFCNANAFISHPCPSYSSSPSLLMEVQTALGAYIQ